jgi:hypothetical protein
MPDSAILASPMVVGLVVDEEEKLSCHLLLSSRNYITTLYLYSDDLSS